MNSLLNSKVDIMKTLACTRLLVADTFLQWIPLLRTSGDSCKEVSLYSAFIVERVDRYFEFSQMITF